MAIRNEILSALILYQYDNTIFDHFRVPKYSVSYNSETGEEMRVPNEVDKDMAVNNILKQTAELSLVYANSPDTIKDFIKLWTDKNFIIWQELWNTMNYNYVPIWNYDRREHSKDKKNEKHVETPDLTVKDNFERNLVDNGTQDALHQVAAFNNGLTDSTKDHSTGHTDATGTTENVNRKTGDITNIADDTYKHDAHMYGNIGVTTTQQMILAQRELVQFNLIDYITEDFKKEFCIMIY